MPSFIIRKFRPVLKNFVAERVAWNFYDNYLYSFCYFSKIFGLSSGLVPQ